MRSSKYDVTTAYGLCQDYLPPDGGDFRCIMYSRRLRNNVTVCTQQSHTPSCGRNSLSDRHFTDTKYNDSRLPGLSEQRIQNSTVRKRNSKIFVFQRQLEISWHEGTARYLLFQRDHRARLFRVPFRCRSAATCRVHAPR